MKQGREAVAGVRIVNLLPPKPAELSVFLFPHVAAAALAAFCVYSSSLEILHILPHEIVTF